MEHSAKPPIWRRRFTPFVLAAVLVSALTFFAMGPALTNCDTTIMGAPGDPTAGGVWLAWQYKVDDGPPWDDHTNVSGAPYGEEFWQPHYLTALTLFSTEWALAQVMSPICSWNITVFLGFLLSGMAMFALAYWLTRSTPAALVAMYAFTFSPFRTLKLTAHVAYVHSEALVLVLLACFLLWQRPTWLRTVAAGAALALCGYTDGYYILLGGVTFAVFHLAAFAYAWLVERWRERSPRQMLLHVAASGAVAVVLMSPLAVTMLTQSGDIAAQTQRSRESLDVYSARPAEYLLPSPLHPVFGERTGAYLTPRLHRSNLSEQNLYLGVVVMLLAAVAVVAVVRRRAPAGGGDGPVAAPGLSPGFVVTVLAVLAVAAVVFSAPSKVPVLGVEVPAPSSFIYPLVKSWRVYARFFVVVHAALVVLAALAVALFLRNRRPGVQAAVTVALVALIAFDQLPLRPSTTWDRRSSPEAYFYVASRPERALAEYPMLPLEADPNHEYLTYQPVHGKRMVNVRNAPSVVDGIARTLAGPGDEGTLAVLRAYGVGLVVVHPGLVPGATPATVPPGLRLLRSFRYTDPPANPARARVPSQERFYNADVYAVEPGPKASVAVAQEGGFFPPETAGWQGFSWMDTRGWLRLVDIDPAMEVRRARVRVTATSYVEPREVRIVQEGRELFRGTVAEGTQVEFTADVGKRLEVSTTPRALPARHYDPASPDNRSLAVALGNFVATPA